jgi:predicted metalloprotease
MVSGTAQAINPPQTTESGVVYYLGGNLSGSIDTFWSTTFRAWGRTYIKPRVTWLTRSRWCGSYVLTMNNSWYCPYDNTNLATTTRTRGSNYMPRYGISTGRLNNADFYEARNTLYSLGAGDHGTLQQRADWFTDGYNSYSLSACNRALGSSTSRSADTLNRPLSATAR